MLTAQVTAAELMHKATAVHTTTRTARAINTWRLRYPNKTQTEREFLPPTPSLHIRYER
jgi:hypothetical protein